MSLRIRVGANKLILQAPEVFHIMVAVILGLFAFFSLTPAAHGQSSINLSRDLVNLGIAAQNMTPNQPNLDARPLFQAALQYAQAHSTTAITVDTGAYYFLTPQYFDRYLVFSGLSNITIDLNGSDIYFNQSFLMGFDIESAQNLVLENFTVDFLQLPFTQVQVSSVDPVGRVIQVNTLPGWQTPSEFNAIRNPYGQAEPLEVFAFRNGQLVPNTSRFTVQRPVTDQSIPIVVDGLPWTGVTNLSAIQPGDTLVLAPRAGQSPVEVGYGTNLTLSHIDIYSSGDPGLDLMDTSGTLIDRVRVIPRPGTGRLVSTNADGITLAQPQAGNTVQFCVVSGTLDDGMSPHALALAFVVSQSDATHLTVTRQFQNTFVNGEAVSFVNPNTAGTLAGATIIAQNPDFTLYPGFDGTAQLTFDASLPVLQPGFPMISASPSYLGSGLVIQNNVIEDVFFARGLSLWGLTNTQVNGNLIRRISWTGIQGYQQLSTNDWVDGPTQNVQIQHNAVEQTNTGPNASVWSAGIEVLSLNLSDAFVTTEPNENINVQNNYVADANSSAAVRVENVLEGSIQGNLLVRETSSPTLVLNSDGISVTGNSVEPATGPLTIISAATQTDEAIAPGSLGIASGTNLALATVAATAVPLPNSLAGTTVSIIDSAGVQWQAPLLSVSPTQVDFLVPSGCALGAAVVSVFSNSGTLSRGAVLIDNAAPALTSINPPSTSLGSDLGSASVSITATPNVTWTASSHASWITITSGASGTGSGTINYTVGTNPSTTERTGTLTINGEQITVTQAGTGLSFVPVAPCRIADTRNASGPFGGPALASQSSRSFVIQSGACGIPSTAAAYSLNVTVVPHQPLAYLTMWPTGQSQPLVSTLNSTDGRIKANAAIVPAGSAGAISVFATDPTDVVLDINGYFVPAETASTALAFYPVTPCRVADTRNASGALGGPSLVGSQTRSFPVISSSCGIPSSAQAYSLNFTVVPQGPLGYLTVWPTGQAQPLASTLNAPTGTVMANAAIVPAGTGGAIDLYTTDNADMVIDVNGYFAPLGAGGLSLFTLPPCRVLDSRQNGAPFSGTINVNVTGSGCGAPGTAQAYVFNATVVPPSPLGYLTLWPEVAVQPLVSTLNALDGSITSNMAIVPAASGSVSAYASNPTQLILDISGYFAP